MAGILITAYMVVGAAIFALIWIILIASKRRDIKKPSQKPFEIQNSSRNHDTLESIQLHQSAGGSYSPPVGGNGQKNK